MWVDVDDVAARHGWLPFGAHPAEPPAVPFPPATHDLPLPNLPHPLKADGRTMDAVVQHLLAEDPYIQYKCVLAVLASRPGQSAS